MLFWSLKTLFAEPIRVAVSAFAVAVSFILVIIFSAVFEGESEKMVAYLERMEADVWVMQKGVTNMHMASSMMWDWKADKIRELPGVGAVAAMLYLNGPVTIGGKDWLSYIIGITPEYHNAGPWSVAAGKAMPGPGEAVIPETIVKLTGVGMGDEIKLIDRRLRVVGISRGTFSMASSVVFVSRTDLANLLDSADQVSYVMVYAEAGVDPVSLAERIESEVDKVNALTAVDFVESDRQLALQMGAEIIGMMTIIGVLLAILIAAFTAYSLVARKRRELAVAKALGFSSRQLYGAALCQSLVVTGLGLVLALGISFTLFTWLPSFVPQINLAVRLHQFIPLASLSLPAAFLASLGAARTVVAVDPMTVFSS